MARGSHAPEGSRARGRCCRREPARGKTSQRVEARGSPWRRVDHHGGAWERVGKRADPSGGACRRVEAWTAMISSDLDSERLICRLVRSVVCVQRRNRLRLHRSTNQGLRHHFWWFFWPRGGVGGGGAIGLGRSCRRNWRRDQQEMGGRRREQRAPKNVIDVYWRPQKSGSDTMLNILYIERKNEREKRESGNIQWTTLYYIVIYEI
jgi:hypothetical protein